MSKTEQPKQEQPVGDMELRRLDAAERAILANLPHAQKLSYDVLNPRENAVDLRPEFRDGRLWLRYAPAKGGGAISVNPSDAARRLPTGVRLRVPEGYAALVCQVEQHNGKSRFVASEVLVGDTDEIEVIYRAGAHHYVHPGRVIGCVLLLPLTAYVAELAK